jgi:hypothetical protein
MIGLGWRNKEFGKAVVIGNDEKISIIEPGKGENTSHGSRINALVTRIGNHPIQKDPLDLRCAAFQTELIRAIQWLTGQKVDTRLPEDFPDSTTVSLRYNI